MTEITISEDLRALLDREISLLQSGLFEGGDSFTEDLSILLEARTKGSSMTVKQLRTVYAHADEETKRRGLKHLLHESRLVFPSLKTQEPLASEELQRRRKYLHAAQEKREYNKMVYGTEVSPLEDEIVKQGNQISSLKNQLSIAGNMIASIVATFGIAYYISLQMRLDNPSVRVSLA